MTGQLALRFEPGPPPLPAGLALLEARRPGILGWFVARLQEQAATGRASGKRAAEEYRALYRPQGVPVGLDNSLVAAIVQYAVEQDPSLAGRIEMRRRMGA